MLEVFNEAMVMLLFYMLVLFSGFNTNPNTFYTFGTYYLGIIGIVLAVNIGLMVLNTVRSVKQKLKLKRLRKEWLENLPQLKLKLTENQLENLVRNNELEEIEEDGIGVAVSKKKANKFISRSKIRSQSMSMKKKMDTIAEIPEQEDEDAAVERHMIHVQRLREIQEKKQEKLKA